MNEQQSSNDLSRLVTCTGQEIFDYGVKCTLAGIAADRLKRVPLTQEQAMQIVHSVMTSHSPDGVAIAFARAFEKHYGIGVTP